MTIQNTLGTALAFAFAMSGIAHAATPAVDASPVAVTWTDPADFTEAKKSPGFGLARATPAQWVGELAQYVERRGKRVIEPGQRLEVTFTDITLAGAFEPWRAPKLDDTRFIKDIYPPAINLTFTLRNADGSVALEGTRKLRDPAFLDRVGNLASTDPLKFEKWMLDDWLRRDFVVGAARAR